jgi:phosphopantetheinyl transferase
MGELSNIATSERVAVTINVPPHWSDHHFQGRAVLPAVEAMQLLTHWAQQHRTGFNGRCILDASFDRFLELPPPGGQIQAWCEIEDLAGGGLAVSLLTKSLSKSGGMARTKVHARIGFRTSTVVPNLPGLDLISALDGVCLSVDPETIYKELVPFGPTFRTISQPLLLTAEGALAVLHAPELTDTQTPLHLGSPFVLDGAFHAACVWSQRFAGIVAFPMGIEQRLLAAQTKPGETYVCRIIPVQTDSAQLTFDIWIVDKNGRLFEKLQGVRMRDVSGGKVHPPGWIRSCGAARPLRRIANQSAAVALIDRATVMPFSDQCLGEVERRRTIKMGAKRLTDYLSARLACKRLSRQLSENDRHTPAREILTLAEDGIRPSCPVTNGRSFHCSVSHDSRFTVAVASEQPIGIDVEPMDERALRSMIIYMNDEEQEAVRASELEPIGAAVRVWTAKEAIAKMLNIHLADAWARTRLLTIGDEHSTVRIKDGPAATVVHESVEDHVFTLVHSV